MMQVPTEMKQPRPDPKNPSKGAMLPPAAGPWARFDPRVRSAAGMYVCVVHAKHQAKKPAPDVEVHGRCCLLLVVLDDSRVPV